MGVPKSRSKPVPPPDPSEADAAFMRLAVEEARRALVHDDVPVGAGVVAGLAVALGGVAYRSVRGRRRAG